METKETLFHTATRRADMDKVIGRNGFEYDAKHLGGNLYIVGGYLVRVNDRKCERTICKATKMNIKLCPRNE